MDREDDQSTDGASIKPVSSLRSHFEALKKQQKSARDWNQSQEPTSATTLDAPRPTFPVRASLDLPRPDVAWRSEANQVTSQAPANLGKGRTSPTRSAHTRPKSMHLHSSPKLTPAVKIESPRSPPQTFFQRSSSRSPERPDTTPFGKVRELISQHSSRTSTRSPTPVLDPDAFLTKPGPRDASGLTYSRSPSRQPPPINRADKPKIPAKPFGMIYPSAGQLTPETQSRRPSMEARISPFSTPPSSGETSPQESPTLGPNDKQSASAQGDAPNLSLRSQDGSLPIVGEPPLHRQAYNHGYQAGSNFAHQAGSQTLGFNAAKAVNERKDPRTLGFSSASQSPPEQPPVVPSRANTLVERSTRDPRDAGFSATPRPTQRAVSETVQPTPVRSPLPIVPQSGSAQPIHARDARYLGFSSDAPSSLKKYEEAKPGLPVRRTAVEPPPRPSDTSKPGARPTLIQNVSQRMPERAPRIETSAKSKAGLPSPSSDLHFPPPPKRNTYAEDSNAVPDISAPPLSRAATFEEHSAVRQMVEDSDEAEPELPQTGARSEYPDATQANRRPPYNLVGPYEINARADPRVFDVCGKYLCVSGYATRVFDMETGEAVMSMNHGETVKITAVKFKPGRGLEDEGQKLWLGNNIGDLQELDIPTHSIVAQSSAHNRREIIRIIRHRRNLITLDDDGKLFVWTADDTGVPSMKYAHTSHRLPKGHTFSMTVRDKLWVATGKEVRVCRPGHEAQFSVLEKPLSQAGNSDVSAGTFSEEQGGKVYLGHIDGKITMYSSTDYTYLGSVKASDYKINGLSFVGNKLWVAYKTGKVYVYDTSTHPWKVKKDWAAHAGPAYGMLLDPSSVWSLQRLQVVTAGHDNYVRLWDATLEEDWMESALQSRDAEYCTFRELRAAVITWNVGAIVPAMLRNDFVADAIHPENPPDIIAFGFQEVVDLEDKAVTAKSLLGFGKKKDTARSEQYQSKVYREWRDYLARCLQRFTDSRVSYFELNTSSLVGLFQCVFIRQEERSAVSMLSSANVKCGMGGHYGNKGALITRFALDDSSICFTNCHLAAGQTQTSGRNNDVANILEAANLPAEKNRHVRSSLFVGGGDGTQILDHEMCILNGDLNYRIDAIPRDTVIRMVRNNELHKLLERDQIMVCRRRVAGFRLSAFTELPITFAPTYKYDPGTDNYDSSEKKRAPAWCDRLLYRGAGRVKQIEYRRHEVKVSDHRPVSGIFKLRVKKVNHAAREHVLDESHAQFKLVKKQMAERVCITWLVDAWGLSDGEARRLISD